MEDFEMTFDQMAREIIFDGSHWQPYRERLAWPTTPEAYVKFLREELLNFYCVLKWGEVYRDMLASDEGMIKLATAFRDCVFDPEFRERHSRARAENDDTFLNAFMAAMRQEASKIEGRKLKNASRQAFLYLNWSLPLLNPELDRGLIGRTVREIQKLAEEYGHEAISEKAFETELRSLKLLPFNESEREKAPGLQPNVFTPACLVHPC